MENLTFFNFLMALLGWLIWNFGKYVKKKDDFEKREDPSFSTIKYIKLNWENWVFSFLFIFVVLAGADYLGFINTFHDTSVDIGDGLYLMAGPLSQFFIDKVISD